MEINEELSRNGSNGENIKKAVGVKYGDVWFLDFGIVD